MTAVRPTLPSRRRLRPPRTSGRGPAPTAAAIGDGRTGDLVVTSITALGSIGAVGLAATRGPLVVVLAALAGITALVIVRRPERIGWTVVALVPVTSGLARGFPVPGVRVSEAVVVGAAAIVLLRRPAERDRWQTLDWAASAYVVAHIALGFVSGATHHALSGEGVRLLLGPVQFFLVYRVALRTLTTPRHRHVALTILVVGTIPVAVLALAQAAGFPPAQQLIEQATQSDVFDRWGWERQGRATGPFASWHPLAGYLFLPLVACAVALTAPEGRGGIPRPLAGVGLAACLSALLASQTLNVMAGAILAVAVAALAQRRLLRVALPAMLAAVVAFSLFGASVAERIEEQVISSDPLSGGAGAPQTVSYRFQVWEEQFLPAARAHWLTGYGPELPPSITWRSTESLYFTLVLRGGVVLVLAFGALQAVILRDAWRSRLSEDPTQRTVALTVLGTTVALVPMHLLFPYYTASGLPQVHWIVLALLVGGQVPRSPVDDVVRRHRRMVERWSRRSVSR